MKSLIEKIHPVQRKWREIFSLEAHVFLTLDGDLNSNFQKQKQNRFIATELQKILKNAFIKRKPVCYNMFWKLYDFSNKIAKNGTCIPPRRSKENM